MQDSCSLAGIVRSATAPRTTRVGATIAAPWHSRGSVGRHRRALLALASSLHPRGFSPRERCGLRRTPPRLSCTALARARGPSVFASAPPVFHRRCTSSRPSRRFFRSTKVLSGCKIHACALFPGSPAASAKAPRSGGSTDERANRAVAPAPVVVMQNWLEDLEWRVPAECNGTERIEVAKSAQSPRRATRLAYRRE